MFIDACAMVAILSLEDDAETYDQTIKNSDQPFTSILAAWEAILILSREEKWNCPFDKAQKIVLEWLREKNITLQGLVSMPEIVLTHAVRAAQIYGVGKKKLSNLDCFHYAFAKAENVPLLTYDRLLRITDLDVLP
jgi:ribonuclease VapC